MTNKIAKVPSVVVETEERIQNFITDKRLELPHGYSVSNALRAAHLVLQETVDMNKKPALEVCTRASVANALLRMVVDGLYIERKQCYFIVYGNKLVCQTSYFGDIAIAKRDGGVSDVHAHLIYKYLTTI